MKKPLLIGIGIGAIVALLASLLLLPPGQGQNTTEASGGSGAPPTIFGVDVDPAGNTATSLGTIDNCIQVESVDSGPGVPGPSFDIDVFLDDVPTGKDLSGADFFMYYDQNYLQVNGWAGPTGFGCRDWLLTTQAGSALCQEFGDRTWPDTNGALSVSMTDDQLAGAEQPGTLGVVQRYEMEVVQSGPQVVHITLAGAPTYFGPSAGPRYDPDEVWDANYSPQYGLIAIDTACPTLTPTPTPTPTSTPTATPTAIATPAPGVTSLALGWNYVCYIDASQPIQDALASISDGLLAVYRLRPDQGYDKWFPDRPDVSTITTVSSYESLLLLMSSNRSWSQNAATSPPASRNLGSGWNSVCYLGQTKEVGAATASIAGKFSVMYVLAPDQSWKRFVPGRPQISNLASLQQFSSVLALVTQAEGAQWVFDP